MRKKLIAALLCFALLPAAAAWAAVPGERVDGYSATLADGVVLTENTYWAGNDLQTEHYMCIEADSGAVPVAVSADTLWTTGSLAAFAAKLEREGLHVLGGSNGGYFSFGSCEPVGLVMRGGVLRTDDEGLSAVGFHGDGSVVFGKPEIRLTLRSGENEVRPVSALNRAVGSGMRLYTADCTASLRPGENYWTVLLSAQGELRCGENVALTVERICSADERVKPAENRMLLVIEKSEQELQAEPAPQQPEGFAPGTELTLEISCAPGWETVDSALGILYPLVESGKPLSGLETAAAPRTAIGVREDGSVIVYTIDGRQSGYSKGLGLAAVAERMVELGCVAAGALDGGGSTQMSALLPGDSALTQVNRPSDGSARKTVNYLLIAGTGEAVGRAERLALYPLEIDAVAGAEIPLTVKAADRNGYASAVPQALSFSVSEGLGEVRDGVFHAAGTGEGVIRVSAPGVESAEIPITVTQSPDTLKLYGEKYGKHTLSLTLEPGQEVDLTVRAYQNHVALSGDDSCYSWTLDGNAGTVDETGHLIPSDASGSGTLTARAGESCVQIPIRIWSGIPFSDVKAGDANFAAVKYVYEHGIFEGTGDTSFDPEAVMSRGMLVTVLWRMSGSPEAEPPAFEDVAPDAWYGPAVAWAAGQGLVNGYSETCFAPGDDLTQEQILTILHRWAQLPETSLTPDDVKGASQAHDYALAALCWAAETGVAAPGEAGLTPRQPMSRAEVAGVLMRWCELLKESETPEGTE